jgi:hypothetical protein
VEDYLKYYEKEQQMLAAEDSALPLSDFTDDLKFRVSRKDLQDGTERDEG